MPSVVHVFIFSQFSLSLYIAIRIHLCSSSMCTFHDGRVGGIYEVDQDVGNHVLNLPDFIISFIGFR